MNKARWDLLLASFDMTTEQETYDKLLNAYSEKHRHYHNATHINACLKHLDQCGIVDEQAHELEMAFWFHDAIYKINSTTNEEDSAAWAVEFLQQHKVAQASVLRIEQYILDTKHDATPANLAASVMVDIDLSILGSDAEAYEQFELDIAHEYRIVPKLIFKKKRRQVLASFLGRDHIYHTEYYRQRFEEQARINLQRVIKQLS